MSVRSLTTWHSAERCGEISITAATATAALSESAARCADEPGLVARSRNGDLEAFGDLYVRHEQAVYRYAYRLLDDADEADDVRQETFVRAYQALTRFRGDAAFRTYLLTICGNLCRDRQRQRRRRPERRYGLEAPETGYLAATAATAAAFEQKDPLDGLERAAQAETVWKALRRLTAAEREILILRHIEGQDLDAVARITGCTRVSAPVRLFRARARFKQVYLSLLQEEGER